MKSYVTHSDLTRARHQQPPRGRWTEERSGSEAVGPGGGGGAQSPRTDKITHPLVPPPIADSRNSHAINQRSLRNIGGAVARSEDNCSFRQGSEPVILPPHSGTRVVKT